MVLVVTMGIFSSMDNQATIIDFLLRKKIRNEDYSPAQMQVTEVLSFRANFTIALKCSLLYIPYYLWVEVMQFPFHLAKQMLNFVAHC